MGILYDARKLKALEFLTQLCEYAGKDEGFAQELWTEFLNDGDLYDEFSLFSFIESDVQKCSLPISKHSSPLSDTYMPCVLRNKSDRICTQVLKIKLSTNISFHYHI